MKKTLFSLAFMLGCSITGFSQETPTNTSVQMSAAKIILQADNPKDEKPVYNVHIRNKSDELRTSELLMTYDDEKKYVVVESEEKDDVIEASFVENPKKDSHHK